MNSNYSIIENLGINAKKAADKLANTHNDKKFPEYKNKIYGLYKPGKKALENLSKNFPGHTIHALKADIRNLPE